LCYYNTKIFYFYQTLYFTNSVVNISKSKERAEKLLENVIICCQCKGKCLRLCNCKKCQKVAQRIFCVIYEFVKIKLNIETTFFGHLKLSMHIPLG